MEPPYTLDGILMFHFWYINISRHTQVPPETHRRSCHNMNGESKRSFAVALASFAIGAVLAGVLGDPKTRAKISESSKDMVKRAKKLGKRADLA